MNRRPNEHASGRVLAMSTAAELGPYMAEFGATKDGETTNMSVREAEAWFRLLIENVEDYTIFLLDGDGRAMSWNAGVQRLLGYDIKEFLGLPFGQLFGPDDHAVAQRDLDCARTTGRAEANRSHRDKDGRDISVTGRLITLWDSDHRLRGYVYVMRDRTADENAATGRHELLRRERVARAEADRANRTKEAFLAAVSHELRTPLNAILGWAHLLSDGHLRETQAARAIEIIERNAKAQARLIDDLLDASRMVSGALDLDVHVLTVSSVVRTAVESVQSEANAKSVHVVVWDAGDLEPIEGDAARLRRAMVEVLVYAITCTPANGAIAVRLGRTDREAQVTVRDTGDGLSPEALAHLFDRFDPGAKPERPRGGLGLGLAIARHIIEAHGGTIEAASEGEGKGTTLMLRMPFARGRQTGTDLRPTPVSPDEACPPGLAGRCALVVEDQPDSRDFVDAVLEQCGMRVIAVESVHEAVKALDVHSVDVIISDIGLATEDGLTLMRRVRARPPERGGSVPAIAVSAYRGATDRTRAIEAGYQTYLAKPLDPADVIAAVAALLRVA
jgi:PAS domain S-box-containing protein